MPGNSAPAIGEETPYRKAGNCRLRWRRASGPVRSRGAGFAGEQPPWNRLPQRYHAFDSRGVPECAQYPSGTLGCKRRHRHGVVGGR